MYSLCRSGFNRTFMELKQVYIVEPREFLAGFNRTFMELKLLMYGPNVKTCMF